MSKKMKIALISAGASIIAAIIKPIINALFKKKAGGDDNSVNLKQKGNNNIQIGKQIYVTSEEKRNERDK